MFNKNNFNIREAVWLNLPKSKVPTYSSAFSAARAGWRRRRRHVQSAPAGRHAEMEISPMVAVTFKCHGHWLIWVWINTY